MTYFVYPRRQLWYGSEPGTMKSTLRFPALYLMLLYWAGSYSRHWGHSCDARWEACLLWGNKYMCVCIFIFFSLTTIITALSDVDTLGAGKKNKIKSRAWLTFRDITLSYPSVFFPLWFPQDFHFQRYYTTCFQRNSIFSFRKVISQESNTEWCPGYSFSEPILQSQFVLHGAGATWKGADAVSLGFWGPLLPSQSPPAGHPISIWKELSGGETKQATWLP